METSQEKANELDIFPIPPSPLLVEGKEAKIHLDFLLNGYEKFEDLAARPYDYWKNGQLFKQTPKFL